MKKHSMLCLALLAALAGCTPKLEDGLAAYKEKNYEKAADIFIKNKNDPAALLYLSTLYSKGLGVQKDTKKAIELVEEAANHGYPQAMYYLGNRYLNGLDVKKDQNKGVDLLEKAGKSGFLTAYVALGRYFVHTNEGGRPQLGLNYFMRAESVIDGKIALAQFYEDGAQGIPANSAKALSYWNAALAMKPSSKTVEGYIRENISELYYYGFGVTDNNPDLAASTVYPSVDSSDDAKGFYAWLLYHGEGVKADPAKAVQMWLDVLDPKKDNLDMILIKNNAGGYAALGLAKAYAAGNGVAKDLDKAKFYFALNDSIHGAGLQKTKMESKGFLGSRCPLIPAGIIASYPGRYRSLKIETAISVADCASVQGDMEEAGDSLFLAQELSEGDRLASFKSMLAEARISKSVGPEQAHELFMRLAYLKGSKISQEQNQTTGG